MTFRELADAFDRAQAASWQEFVAAESALLAALEAAGQQALIVEGRIYLESDGVVVVLDRLAAADDLVPSGAAKNPG